MTSWLVIGFLSWLLPSAGSGFAPPPGDETQTRPSTPSTEGDEPSEAPFPFQPVPAGGVPEEYLDGVAYLGNYREAWRAEALADPVLGRIFLALQDGATRQELEKLQVPDLDLALEDLTSSRMIRKMGEVYRPAFPLIRGESGSIFSEVVRKAAESVYPEIRPYLKKAKKAAAKERVSPWLFALVWSEVFDARTGEEMLIDAGAIDARRMRDEGYFWIQAPRDPFLMGVDRYGSGSETLHYVWTPISYLNPLVQDFRTRRQILDGALAHLPWIDPQTEEALQAYGILDNSKRVAVPSLKKNSPLLAILRDTCQLYVKRALASLRGDNLPSTLKVPRDEAFTAAFATLGFRLMEKAQMDGWVREPDYLASESAPTSRLVEALVATPDETSHPLEHAYYLYDRGDFNGSIQQVKDFLKAHPGDSEALFRLGIAYMKLRKYPEALETFEKGIALPADPGDVWRGWFLIRSGNTLDMLKRRDDALLRYEQALACADVNGSRDTARQWLEDVYQD